MRRLRWYEVEPHRFALIDAKTGPRHVLLRDAVRELLHGFVATASGKWKFPGDEGNGPLGMDDLWRFSIRARDAAGIAADARLQDLRHEYASHTVISGESLQVVRGPLGQCRVSTTNRFVHLDDATLRQATERVVFSILIKLHCSTNNAFESFSNWKK